MRFTRFLKCQRALHRHEAEEFSNSEPMLRTQVLNTVYVGERQKEIFFGIEGLAGRFGIVRRLSKIHAD
jgi:hypothetical protein